MIFGLSFNEAALAEAADSLIRDLLADVRDAVLEETRGLEQDLEKITRLSVKGKLWRAWTSDMWPKSGGIAKEPRGRVMINGGKRSRGAMTFFTKEGRLTAGGGGYLAIPTEAAGSRGRVRNLTPGEWEQRTGKRLRFVYRRGRASLLVADMGTLNKRTGNWRPITRGRTASDRRLGVFRGEQTIPIFVLIPFQNFQPRFSVQPLIDRREGMLKSNIERRMGRRD